MMKESLENENGGESMGCHLNKTSSSNVKADEVQTVLVPHRRPSNNLRNSGWGGCGLEDGTALPGS